MPAVEEVLKTGMIDPAKIGLTGHSWGAYQTTFVIIQTDIFNAAVAGAPLTNRYVQLRLLELRQQRRPDL